MKGDTKKCWVYVSEFYALLTLTPPPPTFNAATFSPVHVENKRVNWPALAQDQLLCPQSTCNLIARRTAFIED